MLLTEAEFKEAVRKALCACLGISASSTEAAFLIREAYTEPEPAPRPPRNVDVIYYSFWTEEEPEIPAYSAENPEAGSLLIVIAVQMSLRSTGRGLYSRILRKKCIAAF